jgi:hypothetical protein
VDGDPVTLLCLVAHEVRSRRTIRLWQDELDISRRIVSTPMPSSVTDLPPNLAAIFAVGASLRAIDALIEFAISQTTDAIATEA